MEKIISYEQDLSAGTRDHFYRKKWKKKSAKIQVAAFKLSKGCQVSIKSSRFALFSFEIEMLFLQLLYDHVRGAKNCLKKCSKVAISSGPSHMFAETQ